MGKNPNRPADFRCGLCGVSLGPKGWLGKPPHLYTVCGCYPPPKEQVMRLPAPSEKVQAILDARADVASYLESIGKIEVFADFTKDEICGLIRAAQDGVQKSLRRQGGDGFEDGEIPF